MQDGEPLEDWPFVECEGESDAANREDHELREEDMELFEDIEPAEDDYYEDETEVNMTTCVGRTVVTMGLVNRSVTMTVIRVLYFLSQI